MRPRRHFVAALVLLTLALVSIEETLVHTDDGCVLETHCNACLLQLATPAVVAAVFSPPGIVLLEERVTTSPAVAHEQAAPRRAPSRGPPTASGTLS